jgi:putative intracellular protease/amidase
MKFPNVFTALTLADSVTTQGKTLSQLSNANRTLSLGIIAFPGFEPLDIFGPLEVFYQASHVYNMTLSVIAPTTGPISAAIDRPRFTRPIIDPKIDATHTFETAPDLNILLVPGGVGLEVLDETNNTVIEDFIAARYDSLDYLLSVCIGAVNLAKAGVLEGKRATTSKASWAGPTGFGKNIEWVPNARWVEDGKIWTSSGVAAGK